MLERVGHTVVEAAAPATALAADGAVLDSIDVLLTDVVMPGLNGRELSERLQARKPGLRVLFMSGYTDDEVIRHGLAASAQFLNKPFRPGQLVEAVNALLRGEAVPVDAGTGNGSRGGRRR